MSKIKNLSVRGLAQFITSSATKQRNIVRDFKYPSHDEAHAKTIYYREAKEAIKAYHLKSYDKEFLKRCSEHLLTLSMGNTGQTRIRLRHNARAVSQYLSYFGENKYSLLNDQKFFITFHDVTISVYPDLHVMEKNVEKIIKFGFDTVEPAKDFIKVITQCLFSAAIQSGKNFKNSNVLYFDVPRGNVFKGAHVRSSTLREIESACQTISNIWDKI